MGSPGRYAEAVPTALLVYTGMWSLACVVASLLVLQRPRTFTFADCAYVRFLLEPWKLTTFVLGAGFFILAAPYTGDAYWDHVDGAMMSVFTYLSAPWAVGTLYRARQGQALRELYVAATAWLFSASWCYDGYLLFRDHVYPRTWLTNLLASGTLYLCAGLFWNVTYRSEVGVTLAFARSDWLTRTQAQGRSLLAMVAAALLLSGIVVVAMWPYLQEVYERAPVPGVR
jgi:hypothetical protein